MKLNLPQIKSKMTTNRILKSFFLPVAVLIIHAILLITGVYYLYGEVDIPMHFLGGAAAAFMTYSLLKIAEDKDLLKTAKSLHFLFVISLVALIAIGWEFFEFIIDMTGLLTAQLSIADTMGDLLMGLLGVPFGYLLGKKFV